MRERAQASVETIALLAAAIALAAALAFGVARLGPPLAATLGQVLAGGSPPGTAQAPGLDGLERALLDGATGPDAGGPTLLDVRTQLRSRLGATAGDVAFDAAVRPLVERALKASGIESGAGAIDVVGRAAEDAWLHDRFHPGFLRRAAELGASITPAGSALALRDHLGLGGGARIPPGSQVGDVVSHTPGGGGVVLRSIAGSGLVIVGDLSSGATR